MNPISSARWKAVLAAAVSAMAVAAIGGTLTDLGPWYQKLRKPSWQPPDAAFGLIWTAIFSLAAAAGVIGWRRAGNRERREWLVGLFSLNGFLNVFWSLLFFRLRRPDWALVEVAGLWLSIAILMLFLAPFARLSSLLLAPYLIWVSVAWGLNLAVVQANGPFG